ncbi:putative clathrin assembly protein At1g25240 [Olea europaea var. sylvestris]|uniref:putative clathrin assembly protein At1g25240 n=1 Tax=Olea europaea var. sylvestris TaxID=158386 RepID=UPI000C1CFC81|nr:putative clathrin assembly protein At1g25240 [Olea europaea var. sylvestris]
MRLWRRASAALKDQNSIWISSLSRRTALRNPDIESAVIKATNHYESSIDVKNTDRVFKWIRLSTCHVKPLVWSISNRMEKTRSWVVALKGLILMHGVINCNVQAVQKVGRLPFDLSDFTDGHSDPGKTWAHNAFIREYYAFLDQKSIIIYQNFEERKGQKIVSIIKELQLLKKLQGLLDLLLQIKPKSNATRVPLVQDAMDGIIIEIFDIYSKICRGIAIILVNVYPAKKAEATMALELVQKAKAQSDHLSLHIKFCQQIGVVNAMEFPMVEKVPEEGVEELKEIINGLSESEKSCNVNELGEDTAIILPDSENANEGKDLKKTTIITDKWEKFEEDLMIVSQENPFSASLITPVLHSNINNQEQQPDLINF